MKAYLPAYDLEAPGNLQAVLRALAGDPGTRPFAGGTDLMVLLEAGTLPRGRYVSLWGLPELRGIDVTPASVTIGALTTYSEVIAHPVLQAEFPLLTAAALQTGGIATQNRGTLGGNIANASPAADSPPALLVYDAELELISIRGSRRVPYDRFHTGYKEMDLAAGELIRGIRMPRRRPGWAGAYRKVGARRAQAISKVCFAAAAVLEGDVVRDIRVALGSVAPTVVRCAHTEAAIRSATVTDESLDAARKALALDIAPIDDIRSTAGYRLRVAENLLIEFLSGMVRRGQA
jgi:CO/xanthine dehydrogenase FAD-binding subunit